MNALPLIQRLKDAGIGTPGTDLFVNMMPAECQLGVLIRPPLTGTKIDYELPGFYKTSFQLITRSHDFLEGQTRANAAVAALLIKNDTQVGDMLVRYCRPGFKPVAFPLSDGNFIEFNVRMDICFNEGE